MAPFDSIASSIIKEQQLIIGPMAWSEAKKVGGLSVVNQAKGEVHIEDGDPKGVIDKLVAQYERLFGKASHEVCKEAAAALIRGMPRADVPASLLA